MNLISILSTLAMAVGLAAALPQILQMIASRSSAGQSVLGWGMGLVTNLSMAYVNLAGFGAKALMASNLLSAGLCVAAMALIVRFGRAEAMGSAVAGPSVADGAQHYLALVDLPTTEFAALRDVVAQAEEARERRPNAPRASEHDFVLAAA